MTHSEILRRLDEIDLETYERGFGRSLTLMTADNLDWLISTLRASLVMEQKLREALEKLRDSDQCNAGYTIAIEALEETSEEGT